VYAPTDAGQTAFPTSGGTALNLRSQGGVTSYTLPFSFSLYNTAYTSVIVSSQGYLQFAGPNSTGYDTASLSELANNVRIAPFWASINTENTSASNVYVTTNGTTSVTFRWQANAVTGNGQVNFSVTLFSNGSFSFAYGAGNAGLNPIIGVSAGNGQVYVLSSYNGGAALGNVDQQLFTPLATLIYPDIGAFEFQGTARIRRLRRLFRSRRSRPTTAPPAWRSPAWQCNSVSRWILSAPTVRPITA